MRKSGLYYLKTYLAPGSVFVPEDGTEGTEGSRKLLRPGISEDLKHRPESLRRLREDLPELMMFVKELEKAPDLRLPLRNTGHSGAERSDGLTFLEGFKTGILRLEENEEGIPVLTPEPAFTGAFSKPRRALEAFVDRVRTFGPPDREILLRPEDGEADPCPDPEDFSEGAEETILGEFRLTYLDPIVQAVGEKRKTVLENVEWSLEKLTGILKDLSE